MSAHPRPLLTSADEARLWQRLRDGDLDAFGVLSEHFYRNLFNYGRRFTTDRDLIHDSIQDLFLYLWEHRRSLPATDQVKYYVLRSFRNQVLRELRNNRLSETDAVENYPDVLESLPIDTLLVDEETRVLNARRLKHALVQLSPRQQEVIHLRFYEDLDNDQIAQLMAVNRQSVANLVHSALQRLKLIWQTGLVILLLLR